MTSCVIVVHKAPFRLLDALYKTQYGKKHPQPELIFRGPLMLKCISVGHPPFQVRRLF
jgi:hypothetical protein